MCSIMSYSVVAQKSIIIEEEQTIYTLDSSNFDPIVWENEPFGKFNTLPNQRLFMTNPNPNEPVWYKFDVINRTKKNRDWIFVSYFYSIDEIDIYLVDSAGNKDHKTLRVSTNLYDREIHHKQPSFGISIKPGETKNVFIRIKNESTYEYTFGIFSNFKFFSRYFKEYLVVGLFYGLMLFVFIYTLINYLFFRKSVVLLYLIFIVVQTIHMLYRDGNAMYIFPTLTEYVDLFKNLSRAGISVFILLYTISFIKLKKTSIEYKLVIGFIVARIIYAAIMLDKISPLTFHFELFAILISTALCIKANIKKESDSKYLMVGLSIMSISYFFFYMSVVWISSWGSCGFLIMYVGI
jgi:hypothetical protein